MIKSIAFIIPFVFCSFSANPSLSDKCSKLFESQSSRSRSEIQLSQNKAGENLYAHEVFFSVYKNLVSLKGVLPPAEIQSYVSQLEKVMDLFENHSSHMKPRLKVLEDSQFLESLKSFPKMIEFIKSDKVKNYESLDTQNIIKLVLSTFSQHTLTYLTHSKDKLDWSRFQVIIKSISDFNNEPSVFTLYKIQRAVKEKYSIKEYINCK